MASHNNQDNQNQISPLNHYASPLEREAEVRGEPVYLAVGYLRRAHGVHGEMTMEVLTDFPERLKPKATVFVGKKYQPMTFESVRKYRDGLLVKFGGLNSPEDATRYRNQLVYVTAADRPKLPQGEFYHHELIGFNVVDEDERSIGSLSEIMQTGANDVYVVTRPGAHELLLPVIPSVVLEIDAERRLIRIHLMEGLIEESQDPNRKS